MFTLDLGFHNLSVYKGCQVTEVNGRHRLDTPFDSAVIIIAQNILGLVSVLDEKERDVLVLTGGVPPEISTTAYAIASPFFKKARWYNGNRETEIEIPTPPTHHNAEPE